MVQFSGVPLSESAACARAGVLLVNVGTPDAPTVPAVRRFLARFLSDRRVVDLPPFIWLPFLYGVVLPLRPLRSAHAYRKIWSAAGSPLKHFTASLAGRLQTVLDGQAPDTVRVAYAMCYSRPTVAEALEQLVTSGCERLLVLPLYPQYSSSTTAAVFDQVTRELSRWRRVPSIGFVSHYFDDPTYIAALAATVREHWSNGRSSAPLLFSFHGVPARLVSEGDPYFRQCHETARLVAKALDLDRAAWSVAFQSRFGRVKWLEPGTAEELIARATRGERRVAVIAPSFAVDCLETLEEIAIRYRDLFLSAGGHEFEYIPALNAREDHARLLQRIVNMHIETGFKATHEASGPQIQPSMTVVR